MMITKEERIRATKIIKRIHTEILPGYIRTLEWYLVDPDKEISKSGKRQCRITVELAKKELIIRKLTS